MHSSEDESPVPGSTTPPTWAARKSDQGLGIAVDSGGYAYIVGSTQSTDIPVINAVIDGNGNTLNSLRGTQNAYLAKITPDGTAAIMSAYLGGNGLDSANGIALSKTGSGDIYVAGTTTSTNFPIVPLEGPTNDVLGRSVIAGSGTSNAFVTRISGASFPKITLSTTNLNFPAQAVGWISTAAQVQTVTLTNSGTGALNFISPGITASGDFSVSNNTCGTPPNAQLAAGASCVVTVSFMPTQANTRSGVLTILDDAIGSPQTVGLQGNGVLVLDTVSPATLTFGSTTLGATSASQTVTVTNTDSKQTLIISSAPVFTGDFSLSSNGNGCTTLLAPGQSCTIGVTFTPIAPGSRVGTMIVNGNGATFPATVQLVGTGNGAGTVSGTGAHDGGGCHFDSVGDNRTGHQGHTVDLHGYARSFHLVYRNRTTGLYANGKHDLHDLADFHSWSSAERPVTQPRRPAIFQSGTRSPSAA